MQIKLSDPAPSDNCHMYLCEKVGLSEFCCKRIHSDLCFDTGGDSVIVRWGGGGGGGGGEILGKRLPLSQDNTCTTPELNYFALHLRVRHITLQVQSQLRNNCYNNSTILWLIHVSGTIYLEIPEAQLNVIDAKHQSWDPMKGKQSLELLKRALEIKKHVYGEDHPNIARTLLCLSETYHDMGDIHQAKKMAQDAFLLLQSTHDPPRK